MRDSPEQLYGGVFQTNEMLFGEVQELTAFGIAILAFEDPDRSTWS